ncbi:hypothetical protein FY034_18960 (plasmid) [Trichlorobacter lovleyi]|uniref:hypothetical protein n=1 Tax=Trichlorobacter lovleyi TaxID=313985 RepID=UPI00223F0466|nr:hypothetical protein [Trichlorobacter lovleyi]QOX81058.1 hypothetical protein FY034_18960 [Trichlorobacter lovleyi]
MSGNNGYDISHEVFLLIEEADACKDPSVKQSAADRLTAIAERLTVGHTNFQSFNELLAAAEMGYRPTLFVNQGDHFRALADIYDYGQKVCGRTARAYRK